MQNDVYQIFYYSRLRFFFIKKMVLNPDTDYQLQKGGDFLLIIKKIYINITRL